MTDRLKSLYMKGTDEEFLAAAREDLPYLWGRMSLLEEFYSLNAPGFSDRSRVVAEQLGAPIKKWKPSLLRRLVARFS